MRDPALPIGATVHPLRLPLAALLAILPLAAQSWSAWGEAGNGTPLQYRIANEGPDGSGGHRLRWELVNRSDLFHLDVLFAFSRPDQPGVPALAPRQLRLAPGQVVSGLSTLPLDPDRGLLSFVAAPCFLPTAAAAPTCRRPGDAPPPSEMEAEWERYQADLRRAVAGNPEGLAGVARVLAQGLGAFLPRDPEAAVRFYARAGEAGHLDAMKELAQAFHEGTWIPADPKAATRWYARAAAQGDAESIRAMIPRARRGIGMEPSATETLTWVRRAVALDDPDAVVWLARLHQEGLPISGTEWSAALARLSAPSEEGGELQKAHCLAVLQEEGLGVPRDEARALAQFITLADQGLDDALIRLAGRVAEGRGGLARNPALAWTLLQLVGEFSRPEETCTALAARLEAQLPAAQRARAEAQAVPLRKRAEKTGTFGLKPLLAKG